MPGNPQRACSQFDIVEMCGFPKDYFYYYKAWWRKEPSLHVFPHWNWHGREGDEIPVWVYSNLEEVELLVNDASLGRQKVPHPGDVQWNAKYEPGAIEALPGWEITKMFWSRPCAAHSSRLALSWPRLADISRNGECKPDWLHANPKKHGLDCLESTSESPRGSERRGGTER